MMEKDCPACRGTGEKVTAYICFGANPRHETMECFNCEGTGKFDVYILNQLEKEGRGCKKHRMNWGSMLFQIGSEWKQTKSMREYQRLRRVFSK